MSDLRRYISEREARDPEFRKLRAESQAEFEIALQVAILRKQRAITQQQLASLIGTRQSAVSRLERGNANTTIAMLEKVAAALGSRLQITLVPEERDRFVKA